MASGPLLAVPTISKLLPFNCAEIMASMARESSTAKTLTFLLSLTTISSFSSSVYQKKLCLCECSSVWLSLSADTTLLLEFCIHDLVSDPRQPRYSIHTTPVDSLSGHAEDHGRSFVLSDSECAGLLELQQSVGTVVTHAG